MIRKLLIPAELGESIEVRLLDWLKSEGEPVDVGDALLEFETDKALVLVTAAQAGFLRQIVVNAGDWTKPGVVVAVLSDHSSESLAGAEEIGDALQVTFDVT